ARSVDAAASAATEGALSAGPLSAEGNGSIDGAANAVVDPGPAADRVTSTGRQAANRARATARNTADRARSSLPAASFEGAANAAGSATATSEGVSAEADGNGSARASASRNPD